MPDGVLSDTLHLTVTSGLPARAVLSQLFIKKISMVFFFFVLFFLFLPPVLMNSRPFPPLLTNELPSEV